jgi:hypothetical protein
VVKLDQDGDVEIYDEDAQQSALGANVVWYESKAPLSLARSICDFD